MVYALRGSVAGRRHGSCYFDLRQVTTMHNPNDGSEARAFSGEDRPVSNAAPQLSRHLGDYLLVAPLSDDALGSVFRALHAADERRFVRLRILRSSELSAEAIEAAILENASRRLFLAHPAIVDRTVLDIVDGVPFMTWDETSGWTLDAMLSRVRAYGIRIPAEYALLIAERLAAALEHAHRTESGGRAVHHGLLWPGFVSISHDAAVRVGGFGLAEAILPSLSQPRLAAEVAPYLAPESRLSGVVDPTADVYALGMILSELLTGRRPTVDAPLPELRAGDPRSDELETFLHRCLAPRETRFASAVDAHREIQRMVTGNPFSLYTANLALFLYKLLNPESQLAAPSSDWESTNPVVLDPSADRRLAPRGRGRLCNARRRGGRAGRAGPAGDQGPRSRGGPPGRRRGGERDPDGVRRRRGRERNRLDSARGTRFGGGSLGRGLPL